MEPIDETEGVHFFRQHGFDLELLEARIQNAVQHLESTAVNVYSKEAHVPDTCTSDLPMLTLDVPRCANPRNNRTSDGDNVDDLKLESWTDKIHEMSWSERAEQESSTP